MARKRIPADVKDEYARLYGKRAEERFTTAPGLSAKAARRLWLEWSAEIETRIENIRAQRNGQGVSLTKLQARALAGEWYAWFVARNDRDGGVVRWSRCREAIQDALVVHAERQDDNPDWTWEQNPDARLAVRPMLADFGETSQFLAAKGMALAAEARDLFLDNLYADLAAALSLLLRRAEGDYSPDQYSQRFPKLETTTSLTPQALFDKWIEVRKPAASTVDRWRGVFLEMQQQFSGGVSAILPEEAQRWIDGLTNGDREASTVRDVWLNAARTVCGWGVERKLLPRNPFEGLSVTVPRRARKRETNAFRPHEALTILKATIAIDPSASPMQAARRWVPWLCAYTGARAGEITQARGQDVFKQDGVHALRITPEAGTVKTGRARIVPLHEHLVAQGFLEFTEASGKGPLFYNVAGKQAEADPTNPRKPRAVKTRERVAEWVRSLGITDSEIQPNHAWRHTFKQIAARHGIAERISDFITGHAPVSVGRGYGAPTLADMAKELKKFPRYSVGDEKRTTGNKKKPKRTRKAR